MGIEDHNSLTLFKYYTSDSSIMMTVETFGKGTKAAALNTITSLRKNGGVYSRF